MTEESGLTCPEYGTSGTRLIVLHGGPGSPGYLAELCRHFADRYRVLEPYQRRSDDRPLTVSRHVEDLRSLIEQKCEDERPTILGHSWGGMLALAFAAEHPNLVGPLVLVGCGSFDPISRRTMRARVKERLDTDTNDRLEKLPHEHPDRDEQMAQLGKLLLPIYSADPEVQALEYAYCDARAYNESWNDMMALQRKGRYPQAFKEIASPVLMLHGAEDPHPGNLIRAGLEPHIPQLEFLQWPDCGHYPWLERSTRDQFYAYLRGWLPRAQASMNQA